MGEKPKVAIACQGGGSHTAFTAGVLRTWLAEGITDEVTVTSFSGTSGGAICAALAWSGMLESAAGKSVPAWERLDRFWAANATCGIVEEALNDTLVGTVKMMDEGLLPRWTISPESPARKAALAGMRVLFPRFYDFQSLLEEHIPFDELASLVAADSPVLLLGAANVLTGGFKKFCSTKGEIQVEALLASTAVPTIFPAVRIGEDAYWDGLFSDNPPISQLLDPDVVGRERQPDQLWVIQVNPGSRKEIPVTPEDIFDRRNEMIGNASLFHDLNGILRMNRFLGEGAFQKKWLESRSLRPVSVFMIPMSEAVQKDLHYASKLDRSRESIARLMEDGALQARRFLKDPASMHYSHPAPG